MLKPDSHFNLEYSTKTFKKRRLERWIDLRDFWQRMFLEAIKYQRGHEKVNKYYRHYHNAQQMIEYYGG